MALVEGMLVSRPWVRVERYADEYADARTTGSIG